MSAQRRIPFSPASAGLSALLLAGVASSASADILFNDFNSTTGLTLVGSTFTGAGFLQLTPNAGFEVGAAWFDTKQRVADGFETTFEIRMISGGADGMAFVIQNDSDMAIGLCGGSQGYSSGNSSCVNGTNADIAEALVVEFDTWPNGEYMDPDDNHVSVHMQQTADELVHHNNSLGSTNAIPTLNSGQVITVKIDYDGQMLSVFVNDLANPALVVPVDIKGSLNLDGGKAWVGFTGATGGAIQVHAVKSWSFTEVDQFLDASASTLSVMAGGTVDFTLSAGAQFAGLPYLLMGSILGTSPGLAIDATQTLPLNPGPYWIQTLTAPNVPPLVNSFGNLDAAGTAQASFVLPPNSDPALAGLTLDHAFVVIELLPTLLHVVHASDAVSFLLLP